MRSELYARATRVTDLASRVAQLSPEQQALLKERLAARSNQSEVRRPEAIAIVGMACRFPGAESLEAFWTLLERGEDAIGEVPPERWSIDELFDPDPRTPGQMNTRWGGFLKGVTDFDADFFGISPREASRIDPQQRLILETAWHALEDAGIVPETLAGSPTGVYVGIFMDDYRRLELRDPDRLDGYTGTGSTFCIAANRVSYLLDLRGPSMSIDTACSSSLVAVYLACQSLWSGETTLALAGGVNLLLTPEPTIEMTKAGLMSPDGRCRTFDARANGYVRSEGAGVVVLKPLSRALADGDAIYALIRGGAINQDGRTNGITSPNRFAQEAALRTALERAGLSPLEVQYVEAHGTGTAMGDAIECRALGAVYGSGRTAANPLLIGSVKTNIGHLETAAGVASLIKVASSLHRSRIPRSLHFEHPNPEIPFSELGLRVQSEESPWPRPEARTAIAGLSSFGFGGTNAHLILEQAPSMTTTSPEERGRFHLLALSARQEGALRELAGRHAEALSASDSPEIRDWCASTHRGRSTLESRAAFVAPSKDGLVAQLREFATGDSAGLSSARRASQAPRIAFLFSGQGAQFTGMGRQLFELEPRFRQTLLRCQEALAGEMSRPLLSLLFDEETAEDGSPLLNLTAFTQPALFALEVALADLWRSWGIEPVALLGHSVGEIAAACVGGVMSIEDGCRLVARRARWMAELPLDGAMVAIAAPGEEVAAAIAGRADEVSIAAYNGPQNTVISGFTAVVEEISASFAARGIKVDRLRVSHAFHSPLLEPMLDRLEAVAREVEHRPPTMPLISNLTGEAARADQLDATYWRRHARQPVQFRAGFEQLVRLGCNTFIEIGPGTTLVGLGAKLGMETPATWLPSLRSQRDESQQILTSLATLHTLGSTIDWRAFHGAAPGRRVRVPTYPFQRRRFWTPARSSALVAAENVASHTERRVAPPKRGRLLAASEVRADAGLAREVEALALAHGVLPGSMSQVTGKPYLYLSAQADALIYLNRHGRSVAAIDYTGEQGALLPLIRDLQVRLGTAGPMVNLFGVPRRWTLPEELDFRSTAIGSWQEIDLGGFQLAGGAMRRLRYLVSRYQGLGGVETIEHEVGANPTLDAEIEQLIDEWASSRGVLSAFSENMKVIHREGAWPRPHRVFLVRRERRTEGVLWILRSPGLGDYLMDIEAYRADAPLGCLETGISDVAARLQQEGALRLSLGLTLGTQLEAHPGDDPIVRSYFQQLQREGVLDGDPNFQFKSKFRPLAEPAFLCRPSNATSEELADLLRLLSNPWVPGTLDPWLGTSASSLPVQSTPARERPSEPIHRLHPLLGRQLDLAVPAVVFESEIDLRALSYLNDHRFGGRVVVPAAALMEMVTAAQLEAGGEAAIVEMSLDEALVLESDAPATLQLVLPTDRESAFEIWKKQADDPAWVKLSGGHIQRASSPQPSSSSLEELLQRCPLALAASTFYEGLLAGGSEYGASFRGVVELALGERELLARIELPRHVDARGYSLHPALLDACLHCASPLSAEIGRPGQPAVPIAIAGYRVWNTVPTAVWVHARLERGESDLAQISLQILDDSGRVLAEVERLTCRALPLDRLRRRDQTALDAVLFERAWRSAPVERLRTATDSAPPRIVWSLASGLSAEVAVRLKPFACWMDQLVSGAPSSPTADHESVPRPEDPSTLARWLREQAPPGRLHIFCLVGLDDIDLQRLLESTIVLLRGLSDAGRTRDVRLCFVVASESRATAPCASRAALRGLARVIAQEHPELENRLIQIDDPSPETVTAILELESARNDRESEVWYCGEERRVPRLARLPATGAPSGLTELEVGTHLVTGGFGGLGLAVARRLVERGAKHLVLLARHPPSEDAAQHLAEMRQSGAEIRPLAADVSSRDSLEQALSEIAATMPPLIGIVHAAGAIDDGPLLQQSWERCYRVLAPKIVGASLLDELTREQPLRYFALFSSLTSVVGTPGQAAYAAGNAFLDELAERRRRAGLPAVSLQWGPWASLGMTTGRSEQQRQRSSSQGINELSREDGLAAFEWALTAAPAQVVVAALDRERLALGPLGQQTLFAELTDRRATTSAASSVPRTAQLGAELRALDAESRRERLLAYLRKRVAAILQVDLADLDDERPLNLLGLDSLTVMELRNSLRTDLQIDMPAADLFSYPSVRELTDMLLARLESAAPAQVVTEVAPSATVGVAVESLSDAEVEAMLRQLLQEGLG